MISNVFLDFASEMSRGIAIDFAPDFALDFALDFGGATKNACVFLPPNGGV